MKNKIKKIPLTQGQHAIIDVEDYNKIAPYNWYAAKQGNYFYAVTNQKQEDGKYKQARMHRIILNPPLDKVVDHKNRNGLDNRKVNLRTCTVAENSRNRKLHSGNTTGHRGIYWNSRLNKWIAQIRKMDKLHHLGVFSQKKDAIKARVKAEERLFKDFKPN
jgi:hypothetical protein